jgi:cob(I)alamin adenosyltransferase
MVKLGKIYTRGGDKGKTSLVGGKRVPKDCARIDAYGSVDEANSVIGIARLSTTGEADVMLARIQNDMFDVGADLATPAKDGVADPFAPDEMTLRTTEAQITRLENEIDAMNIELAPLTSFTLPGGSAASAYLHQARTVVRRAERHAVTASALEKMNPTAIKYLNRLSDHLFVLTRYLNNKGADDVLWVPGANR